MKIKAISKHTGETTELRIQDMWDATLWFDHNINLVKPDDNFNPMGSHKNFTFEVIPQIICPKCGSDRTDNIVDFNDLNKCWNCGGIYKIIIKEYFQTEEVKDES